MTYAEAIKKAAGEYMRELLVSVDWNVSAAARIADVGRTQIYRICARHGIRRPNTQRPNRGNPAWQELRA